MTQKVRTTQRFVRIAIALLIGLLFFPANGMAGWRLVTDVATDQHLHGVWGFSENSVFVLGDNETIFHYKDGLWTDRSTEIMKYTSLQSVWGDSEDNLFLVGGGWSGIDTTTPVNIIFHYDGNEWTGQKSYEASGTPICYPCRSVWGASNDDVFAVCYSSIESILHFDGKDWTAMDVNEKWDLSDIWGSANDNVYAVGRRIILRYNGNSWVEIDPGVKWKFNGIWGSSEKDVFVVGEDGLILHYNGVKWDVMESNVDVDLMDVWGLSSNDVFAVGAKGTILHYNGERWTSVASNTTEFLKGVWGASANSYYAVGQNGTILHYSNDAPTISLIENQVINKNESTPPLSFTVHDGDGETMTFSAVSDNPTLVPNDDAHITFSETSGKVGTYTIAVTPAENQSGSANITITVEDSTHGSNSRTTRTFGVKVVNRPEIVQGESVTVMMSENSFPIPFMLALNAIDAEDTRLSWRISKSAEHGFAYASDEKTFSGIGYAPNPNFSGEDSFVVTVTNGHLSDAITVNVVVRAESEPTPAATPSSTPTATPIITPTPNVPLNDTLIVTDDLASTEDLSNGVDRDGQGNMLLAVKWNLLLENIDLSKVNDVHVYVDVDESGDYAYLGRTGGAASSFVWKKQGGKTAAAFRDGPQSGHSYRFRIYALTVSKTPLFYGPFDTAGPVGFESE